MKNATPKLTGVVDKMSDNFFQWWRTSRNKQLAFLNAHLHTNLHVGLVSFK